VNPDLSDHYRQRARRQLHYVVGCIWCILGLAGVRIFVPVFSDDMTIPMGIGVVAFAALSLLGRIDSSYQRVMDGPNTSPGDVD